MPQTQWESPLPTMMATPVHILLRTEVQTARHINSISLQLTTLRVPTTVHPTIPKVITLSIMDTLTRDLAM